MKTRKPLPELESSCSGYREFDRRRWLTTSLSGLGGFGLTRLAEELASADETNVGQRGKGKPAHARSMIILWMQGGPSQLDTFDPHPGSKMGGGIKAIPTSIRDVQIAESLPQTAEQLRLATLIRSVVSKEGDHERATYEIKTGWRPDPTLIHPSLGAVLCHQSEDYLEIPRHISILSDQWPARGGYLGAQHDAFQVFRVENRIPNLNPGTNESRAKERLAGLREIVEREFARDRLVDLDAQRTQHESMTAKAWKMMGSDQIAAFDLSREPSSVRQSFGDTPFGQGCLTAIRLIEAGVRCVEVELRGWDSHANNQELQAKQCRMLDPALSSLLVELERRDLLESTIVLWGGEFGRTPRLNVLEGRDHWQHGFSMLVAGGPFRRGYVHGATSAEESEDRQKLKDGTIDPVPIQDLHATILDSFGVDFRREHPTPIGRPLAFSQGQIVDALRAR